MGVYLCLEQGRVVNQCFGPYPMMPLVLILGILMAQAICGSEDGLAAVQTCSSSTFQSLSRTFSRHFWKKTSPTLRKSTKFHFRCFRRFTLPCSLLTTGGILICLS